VHSTDDLKSSSLDHSDIQAYTCYDLNL